ncbi:unnamed protein product [Urochloa decumbens]|uniref:Ubiquitin-like protease family profile domain-containing protein n=1 Tax=Urochloa decumbens TaxID=240449 RepID=A0ABC9B2Q8_9POAL
MGPKRTTELIDIASSQESDDIDLEEAYKPHENSDGDGYNGSEYSIGGHHESVNREAYKQVLKKYGEIKHLKKKLAMRLNHEESNVKSVNNSNDAFTRFSLTNFSNVIQSLTPHHRKVIDDYGFGSLLLFERCSVPNDFVNWVARLVNYRSADIVCNGKVISLTRESVSLVLGVPLTDKQFPADHSAGKSVILSKFNKKSIPSVTFFSNKILKNDPMSDEDLFVCFIIVALNTFLCPNTSATPCYKYFGIFEDINNLRDLDWCGYILDWLLEGVKVFNSCKAPKAHDGGILAGCLYYLAVIYLDHIDFGVRQVPDSMPRISVWRSSMIETYSEFDFKSPGCYGFHPLLHYSQTCYSKDLRSLYNPQSLCLDSGFHNKLEHYSGCKLPESLKVNICKLIEKYCFNSSVSVHMDVSSVNALPDDMKTIFCKLLKHAYSIDRRSQNLVLDIMKLVSKSEHHDDLGNPHAHKAPSIEVHGEPSVPSNHNCDVSDHGIPTNTNGDSPLHCSQSEVYKSNPPSNQQVQNEDVARVLQKLSKTSVFTSNTTTQKTPARFVIPPSGYPPTHPIYQTANKRKHDAEVISQQPNNVLNRTPLADFTNDRSFKKIKKYVHFDVNQQPNKDVINLENENLYVPDTLSPVSLPGYSKFHSHKCVYGKENHPHVSSGQSMDVSVMHTPDLTHNKHSFNNDVRSKGLTASHHKDYAESSRSKLPSKVCREVEITDGRTLADSVRAMTKKSDDMYNSRMRRSELVSSTPIGQSVLHPSLNSIQSVPYRVRDPSAVDKVQSDATKRCVRPGILFRSGDSETTSMKIHVSKIDVKHYNRICSLAYSEYQGEDAVYLNGVRCTYWSLGESLKPGGQVNTFVVSLFCYSLYHKPNGHPHISKRHYFFSNIADNLLKDIDEADEEVLSRAFKRSSKACPLKKSNTLFFPTMFDEHWFVFIVDIVDKKYVMLDSLYEENDEFQHFVSSRMRASFEYHWNKFVQVDMGFHDYEFIYPVVPKQPLGHENDSGIYAMMCIEHWVSPRTLLTSVFSPNDIPNIRVKIANDLVFQPKNTGMKNRVIECDVAVCYVLGRLVLQPPRLVLTTTKTSVHNYQAS